MSPLKKKPTREEQPVGLVLVDKHFKPLDALMQAYEARLKPLETLEERWKHYPNPAQEVIQLEIFKRLTEATQALEEQLRQILEPKINPPTRPKETKGGMDETPILMGENKMEKIKSKIEDGPPKEEPKPILTPNSSIPEVDEDWGNKLWEAVKNTQNIKESQGRDPPIEEIDFYQKTLALEIRSEYGDAGLEKSEDSKAISMKTLPSYQGEYEAKLDVKKLPSQKFQSSQTLDIVSLTALMSAPIQCALPLVGVLKVKP